MKQFKINMLLALALAVSASAAAFAVAAAQPATIKDGAYTVEQAEAGKELYERRCSSCHNADFYKTAFSNRNNQPLAYMFEEILVTMPADMPGSLMDQEYEQILAHILSITGFPAGNAPLDYNGGSMHTVNIVPPES